MTRPAHHTPNGFRNPWPNSEPRGFRDLLRWGIERRTQKLPPDPPPGRFPLARPRLEPRLRPRELAATWVGHSTVLLQMGALNVLTDPIWSDRASPVSFAGPKRFVPPGLPFEELPPIDVVLLSHNHYDHMDRPTIERLVERAPDAEWVTTLGLARQLARWGVERVRELDWWEESEVAGAGVGCTPAQHFSARGPGDRGRTLWGGFTIATEHFRIYFAGDTALHPEFGRIAERFGPFDLALLPIGAYEPRWFMRSVHMNPDDAMMAHRELTAAAAASDHETVVLPIHWGTFRLTDEAMDEPPTRLRDLWRRAGLDEHALWLLRHGETRRLTVADEEERAVGD